jgi:hypothetical protein
MPDTTLNELLEFLSEENHLGVLLAAQVGGTPHEVQIILQTTELDADHESLKPLGHYIIRAIGVQEHRLSVGLFGVMAFSEENALLHPYTETMMQVYFSGTPQNVDSLMIDLNQLYGQTYGQYDPFRRMAEEINRARPLATLLGGGNGLLGTMPEPFANQVAKMLARHDMKASLIPNEAEHPPFKYQLLAMDDSYFIAQTFSADPMRR